MAHIRVGASFRFSIAALAAGAAVVACAKVDGGAVSGTGTGGSSVGPDAAPEPAPDVRPEVRDVAPVDLPPPCVGLQCQQVACPSGGVTTVTGTVFAPNGTLPLYDVSVYVPNEPLAPFKEGAGCDRCGGATTRSVTSAISNEEGKFRLTNVPVGKDIPVVFQVGKWRRKVSLATVTACQDNPITDPNLSRLPRNRQEGDMPRIAVTTGTCDGLGCLLPKVGIDAAELGVAGENKAVTFYKGQGDGSLNAPLGPPNMTDASAMWRSEAELSKFDLTLLSCECNEETMGKGPMAYDAMTKYLAKGGRIFGSDFMYVWYRYTPDPMLAAALTIQGGAPPGRNPMVIDTSFPKGKAMADWMKVVDPMVTYGQIEAEQVFDNLTSAMMPTARVWASSPGFRPAASHPRIVTINTPAGSPADQQCGRAVHLDAHISMFSAFGFGGDKAFPEACGTKLNKGEEALAFLFFDLAACIQDDSKPIEPPLVIP